jgi:DNA invertase Pin-like site-specific DNA recombinase
LPTEAQDLTSQLAQLKEAGCEKVFREKLTGSHADRPQLRKLIAALSHGDAVIIPAVDRLSRDTTDLLIIAREMQKAVQVSVHWPRAVSLIRPRTLPRSCLRSLALRRS